MIMKFIDYYSNQIDSFKISSGQVEENENLGIFLAIIQTDFSECLKKRNRLSLLELQPSRI